MTEKGFKALIKFRGFLPLWSGQFVSRFGDSISTIAFIWLALKISGSPLIMSTVLVFNLLPSLLFTIPAGAFVDRHSRKKIMIFSSLGRMFITLSIPVLIWTGTLQIWHLLIITFLDSTVECFFGPSMNATIPNIVDKAHLLSANSAMSVTTSISQIVGMGFGGVLIAFIGIPAAFLIDAVTYFVSAISVTLIPLIEKYKISEKRSHRKDIVDGFKFVLKKKALIISFIVAMMLNFGAGALNVIFPLFSEELNMGTAGYGYMIASFSVGSLIGAIALSELGGRKKLKPGNLMLLTAFIWAIGFGIMSFFTTILPCLLVFSIVGITIAMGGAAISTIVQTKTPDAMRGRVLSIQSLIVLSLMPLSAIIGGILAEFWGVKSVFYLVALASFSAFIISALGLKHLNIDDEGKESKNESEE